MNPAVILFLNKYKYPIIIAALVITVVVVIYVFGFRKGRDGTKKIDIPWQPLDMEQAIPPNNFNPIQHAKDIRVLLGGDSWFDPTTSSEFKQSCDLLLSFTKNELILVNNAYNEMYNTEDYPTLRALFSGQTIILSSSEAKYDSVIKRLTQYGL